MKFQKYVIFTCQIAINDYHYDVYSLKYYRTTLYFYIFIVYILVPFAFNFSYG